MAPPETIEQGHPILWRNQIAKGIFHRHVAEIQEMTNQEVIRIQVHEDKPSDIVRTPWSEIPNVIIMNQNSSGGGTYYGLSPGHTYGFGYSGPRMYMGWNQYAGHQVGDLVFLNHSNVPVMIFKNISSPSGVVQLAKGQLHHH